MITQRNEIIKHTCKKERYYYGFLRHEIIHLKWKWLPLFHHMINTFWLTKRSVKIWYSNCFRTELDEVLFCCGWKLIRLCFLTSCNYSKNLLRKYGITIPNNYRNAKSKFLSNDFDLAGMITAHPMRL